MLTLSPPGTPVFARRPIVDAAGQLAGYEVLVPGDADGVLPALADVVEEAGPGSVPAFVTVALAELAAGRALPADPAGAVLLLATDEHPAPADLERLDQLAALGHRFGLDGPPEAADPELARRAGWVRIDARDPDARPPHGFEAIAAQVETLEDYDRCRAAGFRGFQGGFLTQARATANAAPASLARLQTAAALQSADDTEELERAISLDPALSIGLLRFVNSAAFTLRSRVSSVRHAIALLGPPTVRQWATVVLLSSSAPAAGWRVAGATGLARARTCEAIARRQGERHAEAYFLVGLLSVVDVLLGTTMEEVLAELPLAEDTTAALVSRAGPKGHALAVSEALERGAWEEAVVPGMDVELLAHLHTAALRWSDAAFAGLT